MPNGQARRRTCSCYHRPLLAPAAQFVTRCGGREAPHGLPAELILHIHHTLPFDMVVAELDNWCVVEPGYADQYFVAKAERRTPFVYHFRVVEYQES